MPFTAAAASRERAVGIGAFTDQRSAADTATTALDGVPAGFLIMGDTATAPVGYTHAAVMPFGNVYAVGGGGGLATNEEYDPVANTWTTKTPMPTARTDFAAAAVNGKVYAIGGRTGPPLATNEEYSPPVTYCVHSKD